MRLKIIFSIVIVSLLSGCMATSSNKINTAIKKNVKEGTAGVIYICRPSSIIRFAETPSLYINDVEKQNISNGTFVSEELNLGDKFLIGTKANPILFRMKDEEILKGNAKESLSRYVVLEGLANWTQGISVLLGGAIGAAVNSELQDTASSNWKISLLEKDAFLKKCN